MKSFQKNESQISKKGNFKAYPLKTAHIPKHKTVVIIRCKDDILIFFKQK